MATKRKLHICKGWEIPYFGILRNIGFAEEQAAKNYRWTEDDYADARYREARESGELDYIFG